MLQGCLAADICLCDLKQRYKTIFVTTAISTELTQTLHPHKGLGKSLRQNSQLGKPLPEPQNKSCAAGRRECPSERVHTGTRGGNLKLPSPRGLKEQMVLSGYQFTPQTLRLGGSVLCTLAVPVRPPSSSEKQEKSFLKQRELPWPGPF